MLQDEAVRSAEIYLDYLNAHKDEGLGLVRARVRSVQRSMISGEMELTTDRVMKSGEDFVLRIGSIVYENTDEEELYRVLSIERRRVLLEIDSDLGDELESAVTCNEPVFLESDLTFLVKRVRDWYEKNGQLVELPSFRSSCRLDSSNPIALSDNQYDCAVLAMTSPLSYIWGAPGTGKTKHVLASCVLSYIRAGKKVILVAPTNNALEQSLFGLLRALSNEGGVSPAGKVIRLGVPGEAFRTIWPEVCEEGAINWLKVDIGEQVSRLQFRNSLIDESLAVRKGEAAEWAVDSFPKQSVQELEAEKKENTSVINNLLTKSRKLSDSRNIMPAIDQFSVVASTVDACIYRMPPDGAFKPDHVFLDEAGYCNVIKGMTLLGFGKPLTLLGDHMQLPPVFEGEQELLLDPEKKLARLWKTSSLYMEDAVTSDFLEAFCVRDPEKPPRFEAMVRGALTETYRFGPDLAKILAGRIYGPQFCSRSENETKILFVNAPKQAADKGKDEEGNHRRISHSEAKAVRALMENNLSHSGVSVGIITPYRKQRRLLADTIERLLKKYDIEDEDLEDDIVTVHQSQGREWDIVLFSVTDSYDERHFTETIRNMQARKLINTAVSRAKKMLILIGDADDWQGKYGQLISELFAVGKEITAKEKIVEMAKGRQSKDDFVPWLDNYGSLIMAAMIDEMKQ